MTLISSSKTYCSCSLELPTKARSWGLQQPQKHSLDTVHAVAALDISTAPPEIDGIILTMETHHIHCVCTMLHSPESPTRWQACAEQGRLPDFPRGPPRSWGTHHASQPDLDT